MFDRYQLAVLQQAQGRSPAVPLGPRQVGKTTLALHLAQPMAAKRSTTPKVDCGFYSACDDIRPSRKWLIYPGADSYTLCGGVEVLPLHTAMQTLATALQ